MEHCLEFLKKEEDYIPEIIILLQNTSPLRNANHIDDAITLFLKNKNDSMLSGYNSHHFIWKSDGKTGFSIITTKKDSQGTTIILHLNTEGKDFANRWKIDSIIKKY